MNSLFRYFLFWYYIIGGRGQVSGVRNYRILLTDLFELSELSELSDLFDFVQSCLLPPTCIVTTNNKAI